MNQKGSFILILIVILLIASVSIIGAFLFINSKYSNLNRKSSLENNTIIEQPNASVLTSPNSLTQNKNGAISSNSALIQSNYKTYTSPEYSFSFNYPDNLKIDDQEDGRVKIGLEYPLIQISLTNSEFTNENERNLENYCSQQEPNTKQVVYTYITIDKISSKLAENCQGYMDVVFVTKGSVVYSFVLMIHSDDQLALEKQRALFRDLLESFKF